MGNAVHIVIILINDAVVSLFPKGERISRRGLPLLLSAPFNLTIRDIKSMVYGATVLPVDEAKPENTSSIHLIRGALLFASGKPVDVGIIISFITLNVDVMLWFCTGPYSRCTH